MWQDLGARSPFPRGVSCRMLFAWPCKPTCRNCNTKNEGVSEVSRGETRVFVYVAACYAFQRMYARPVHKDGSFVSVGNTANDDALEAQTNAPRSMCIKRQKQAPPFCSFHFLILFSTRGECGTFVCFIFSSPSLEVHGT